MWVFNFSPFNDYEGYKVGAPEGGTYQVVLDSDEARFGGAGRVGHGVAHFTQVEGTPGESSETKPYRVMLNPTYVFIPLVGVLMYTIVA